MVKEINNSLLIISHCIMGLVQYIVTNTANTQSFSIFNFRNNQLMEMGIMAIDKLIDHIANLIYYC